MFLLWLWSSSCVCPFLASFSLRFSFLVLVFVFVFFILASVMGGWLHFPPSCLLVACLCSFGILLLPHLVLAFLRLFILVFACPPGILRDTPPFHPRRVAAALCFLQHCLSAHGHEHTSNVGRGEEGKEEGTEGRERGEVKRIG